MCTEAGGKLKGVDITDRRVGRPSHAARMPRMRTLVATTEVKATPTAQGESVGHYEAGRDVAVIGKAAGGFYYVSPCNACPSGFVPASAVRGQ